MNIPQLDITREFAQIDITSQRAKMEITSKRPSFRLKRALPMMRIERRLPQMRVDRSDMAVMLAKAPFLLANRLYTERARQEVLEAIGQIAAQGTALMMIENPENTIPNIAAQATERDNVELNLTSLPPPVVYWEPGVFEIHWTPGVLETYWDVSPSVDIRVEPHHVEIRLAKHAKLTIRVIYKDKNQDVKPEGKFLDKYL